jgi:hypothetical protein
MNIDDPIRAKPTGTEAAALAVLIEPDAKDRAFVHTLFAEAPSLKINPAVAIAHCYQETATDQYGPLSSIRWNRDLNPAGIGIPADDTPQPFPIGNGTEAARIYLVCLNRLANTPVDDTKLIGQISAAARAWIKGHWAQHCAESRAANVTVKTIRDLTLHYADKSGAPQATWQWNPNGAVEIAQMGSRVFGAVASGHALVPLKKRILSASAPNRPGQKLDLSRGPLHVTVHETGDPNANASQEAAYLDSAEAIARQVSYQLTVDDLEAWQMLPLDEIAWHAGDGCNDPDVDVGCFRSIAIEICVRQGQNQAQAYDNAAQILVRVILKDPAFDWGSGITKGKFDDQHFDQHIRVSQEIPPHDCPFGLRYDVTPPWTWDYFMGRIDYWMAALTQTSPAPTPEPVPTMPPVANGGKDKLPVPGIPLPPGLTTAYLKRRFAGNDSGNITINGEVQQFDPNGPVSRAWLRMCLATIPKGEGYEKGEFPSLVGAVKRAGTAENTPGIDWILSNGRTIPSYEPSNKGKQ